MYEQLRVALIIPARDEEETIGTVVASIDRSVIDQLIVVDNGSRDQTASRARSAGAHVVHQPIAGYGRACLTGIAELAPDVEIVVFMDGDGSDVADELATLLRPIAAEQVDMVIGSRVLGDCEPGALTPIQRFGNLLTCSLVRWFWGVRFTDLGPFRAIRRSALRGLEMQDNDFGWTIEMQVKAAQQQLRVCEVPVSYRCRRAGKSKVSGNLRGSYLAGKKILGYVFSAKLGELR